jgi:DNA adenine methylase
MGPSLTKSLVGGPIIAPAGHIAHRQAAFAVGAAPAAHMQLRPPLKWAGGKRWLVPFLEPIWQPYSDRRLVEPFVGGLAVTFGLLPERALLNDVNPHTINFYRWLKKGLRVELSMRNAPETYDAYRKRFNALIHAGEEGSKNAAELFYYLNRTCYNGLCRFNREGEFNTPMGRYAVINYQTDFRPYAEVMRRWELRIGSFERLHLGPKDFIYADPPYDSSFAGYSKEGFGWEDQVRLVEWLVKHPGPVVLSNQATGRIRSLYREHGFRLQFVNGPRMIGFKGDRTPVREVIATLNIPT